MSDHGPAVSEQGQRTARAEQAGVRIAVQQLREMVWSDCADLAADVIDELLPARPPSSPPEAGTDR